jgi:hypothetical protein
MPAEDVSEASSSFAVSLASPPQAATADDVGAELANVVSPPHCWLGPSERHIDRTAALRGPLADPSTDASALPDRIRAAGSPNARRRQQRADQPFRLREQIDLDTLSAGLLSVVDETIEPTMASLWLRPPVGRPRTS